jgi:hypothetical protein
MASQFSLFTAVVIAGVLAGPAPFDPRPIDASRQDDHGVHAPAPPAGQTMPGMMKMHEQMMADMKANAGRLDALVKAMNAATGAAKTDAIAAVVNELVRQHAGMQAHMRGMHETMTSQHQTPTKP